MSVLPPFGDWIDQLELRLMALETHQDSSEGWSTRPRKGKYPVQIQAKQEETTQLAPKARTSAGITEPPRVSI